MESLRDFALDCLLIEKDLEDREKGVGEFHICYFEKLNEVDCEDISSKGDRFTKASYFEIFKDGHYSVTPKGEHHRCLMYSRGGEFFHETFAWGNINESAYVIRDLVADCLLIDRDLRKRARCIGEFYFSYFSQWWVNTSGCSAMTEQRTYIIRPKDETKEAFVYFAGEFAYRVPMTAKFLEDVKKEKVYGLSDCLEYILDDEVVTVTDDGLFEYSEGEEFKL